MANIPYPHWYPSSLNCELYHAPSIECEIGDLLFYDTATGRVKPASSFTWGATLVATQQAFQPLFVGVADSRQLATDAVAHYARVLHDIVVEMPCASSTFAAGDAVGPMGAPSAVEDQRLIKVTDQTAAIGKVLRYYGSAVTLVKVRLTAAMFLPAGRMP